jgi:hypothetical protein
MRSLHEREQCVICFFSKIPRSLESILTSLQVARQITKLCEISSDRMNSFYNPIDMDKAKGKQVELKKLSEIHQRLETWRRELPKELEPKEGGLPSMLVMQ